jgi:hypothetical protein
MEAEVEENDRHGYSTPTPTEYKKLKQKLDAYERHCKAATKLLQVLGWYPMGWHANVNPCPPLVFSDVYGVENDEDGLPFFEKVEVQ